MNASTDEQFQRAFAAFQAGQQRDAERLLKKVVSAQPRHVGALNLLGVVLTQLERFEEAERYVRRALTENATSDVTFYNYGLILKALKRPADAVEQFGRALAINPAVAETWNNRGVTLSDLGRHREAIADFDKAISLNPNYAEAIFNAATSLAALGQFEQSLGAFERTLMLKPDLAAGWIGRGNMLTDLKRHHDAFAAYDRALALAPDVAEVWLGRGNVYADLKQYADASAAYDRALALKSDLAQAWLGRGKVLFELKRSEEALAAYDKAVSLKPDLSQAWYSRGDTLDSLNRTDEALTSYDKAIALRADFADAYFGKSLVQLSLGRFEEGWDLYEWRERTSDYALSDAGIESRGISTRIGKSKIAGKNIAVFREQGVGDEIMFASILPDIVRDAGSITYQLDPRLTGLFSRNFPAVNFFSTREPQGKFDTTIRTGSLGYVYRRDASAFPRTPYLKATPDAAARWKSLLASEGDASKKIGISWRGGTAKTGVDRRSIALDQLGSLLARDDCRFVSLQYGDVHEEIEKYDETAVRKIIHWPQDRIDDFDELAGLIEALDLVISVQNATVHLCGALGKPCLAMLPWKPEWRYGRSGSQMIWYSSVELFRQSESGNWSDVLSAVNSRLPVAAERRQI